MGYDESQKVERVIGAMSVIHAHVRTGKLRSGMNALSKRIRAQVEDQSE